MIFKIASYKKMTCPKWLVEQQITIEIIVVSGTIVHSSLNYIKFKYIEAAFSKM